MSDRTTKEIAAQVLREKGLEGQHEFAREHIPDYADLMEAVLASGAKASAPEERTNRMSTDRLVRNLNDRLIQPGLFSEEEMQRKSTDELLDLLEERLCGLGHAQFMIHDENGEVTLRGAYGSLRLWAQATEKIQEIANAQRKAADSANECVRYAEVIFSRGRDEGWSD